MSTRYPEFVTRVFIPEEVSIVNCYSENWKKFVDNVDALPDRFVLGDHMYGFDDQMKNRVLDVLENNSKVSGRIWTVVSDQLFPKCVHDHYPHIQLEFNLGLFERYSALVRMPPRHAYPCHPDHDFKNFLCSFNGSQSLSRRLLPAALMKFGWFDTAYVSKHSTWKKGELDGFLLQCLGDDDAKYRKFFAVDDIEFAESTNGFGYERRWHDANIHNLEQKLTESFVHLVSETVATSALPFVTEKALYSVITRGLFVSYAPPSWYRTWTKILGFRSYDKLFDHRFDDIKNPVHRLVELLCMLSRYANLSKHDWHDLHLLEFDAIEFNYEHYFSGDYIRHLDNYSKTHVYS